MLRRRIIERKRTYRLRPGMCPTVGSYSGEGVHGSINYSSIGRKIEGNPLHDSQDVDEAVLKNTIEKKLHAVGLNSYIF